MFVSPLSVNYYQAQRGLSNTNSPKTSAEISNDNQAINFRNRKGAFEHLKLTEAESNKLRNFIESYLEKAKKELPEYLARDFGLDLIHEDIAFSQRLVDGNFDEVLFDKFTLDVKKLYESYLNKKHNIDQISCFKLGFPKK